MKKNMKYIHRIFTSGLVFVLLCAFLSVSTNAYAFRGNRRPSRPHAPAPVRHHHYHSGLRPLLPLGFALLTIAGIQYYYNSNRGVFYRPITDGYVVANPPLGAVVVSLPRGYVTFWSGGVEYYYFGNIYYNRVPSGYVVVDPPYSTSRSSVISQPSTLPATNMAKVVPPMLNVRSGPGANHEVTSQIRQGAILEVHGTSPGWLFVKLPSGKFGWVMEKFTVPQSGSGRVQAEG